MGGTDFWSRRKAGVETEEKIALRDKDAEAVSYTHLTLPTTAIV